MSTKQSATVYITNAADGAAWIQLYHKNSSYGTQSGRWYASPGQKVGPLSVYFDTGPGSWGVMDYWWVNLEVVDGATPGQYVSGGSVPGLNWKECQLQGKDTGQTLNFSVNTAVFNINETSGACSNNMKRTGAYSAITNVFVLMLENHSFDNIFAFSGIKGITAATTNNLNSYNKKPYNVENGAPLTMPTDPGHEFLDVIEQLSGNAPDPVNPLPGGKYPPINNSGFASNYARTITEGPKPPSEDIGDIMKCFNTPVQLKTMYHLASKFAICDHWFSSIPGPTWPNRFFMHGASSAGLDHSPTFPETAEWEAGVGLGFGFKYPNGSIYDAMNNKNIQWRIYNDDQDAFSDDPGKGSFAGAIPQVTAIKNVSLLKVNSLSHFASDLEGHYPYQYTFIEPNYGNLISGSYEGGSSEHPMDDVYGAECLIKSVYEAIRKSSVWNSSLLIITYDEHGGFYDSVAPGPAPEPNDGSPDTFNKYKFKFDQYGVRVPAVIVSPLVPENIVDHTVYDHASALATVEKLFGLGPLTQRDAKANNLIHLLSLTTPRTDCPVTLDEPAMFMKVQRQAITTDMQALKETGPIPEPGSLRGFLHIMLKTDLEMAEGDPIKQAAIKQEYAAIKTRGQADAYIKEVMMKVKAAKAPGK